MANAVGRGIKRGRVTLTAINGGLVIRVDDDEDAEFWCESVVSETELLAQLVQVHRLTHTSERPRRGETIPFDGRY